MTHVLCALFFLSGAAALLFETLWFRQAGLAFGNSVWASSLVLSSFMAGLALGNALAARFADRAQSPVRAYAWLEGLVAGTGVLLVWLLPLLGAALAPLWSALWDAPWLLNALRLGIGFALLLLPATAMGATLPLLVKALLARDPHFGAALGRLYGWNTLGAVAGAVAGEALLVEALGVRGTAWFAAGLDVAALAAALAIAPAFRARPAAPAAPARASPAARRCLAAAALSGAILLAFEVVWFRFLHLFLHSGSRVFALVLGVVLAGIALGGLAGGRLLRARADAFRHAATAALLAGALAVALYAGFGRALAPHARALVADPGVALWLGAALMLPVTLLSGALFTFVGAALAREVAPPARAAGWLTLANTTGAAAGSALAGFLLLPVLGMERSFFALAAAYGAVALLLARVGAPRRLLTPSRAAALAAFAAALVLFPFGRMQGHYLRIPIARWNSDGSKEVVAVREGRTETAVYLRRQLDGEPLHYQLLTDGFSMSATSALARRYQKLFVYWPVALRPDPKSALLISFGVGSTAKALTDTKSLERIDVVDISREILELSSLAYPDPSQHPLSDPRVRVHVEDGRHFLQVTGESYDLITGEPPPPKNAGVVNLYTREYFELVRDRLAEGGIATYWLPVHNTLPGDARAITRAFCEVFPDCSLWVGKDLDWMLAGSRGGLAAPGAEAFARQWRDPALSPELRAVGLETPGQLGALFLADASQLRDWIGGVRPLVDDRPKRLADARQTVRGARRDFAELLDADGARARFAASDFIRRVWPPAWRERALAAFALQPLVQQATAGARPPPREWLAGLHQVITGTDLRTLVLWRLGSSTDAVAAIERLLAADAPEERYPLDLGRRALADRDFAAAARYLERAQAQRPRDRDLLFVRLYALCMAGDTAAAERLAARSPALGRDDPDRRAVFAWLAETFDFEPPSGRGQRSSGARREPRTPVAAGVGWSRRLGNVEGSSQ